MLLVIVATLLVMRMRSRRPSRQILWFASVLEGQFRCGSRHEEMTTTISGDWNLSAGSFDSHQLGPCCHEVRGLLQRDRAEASKRPGVMEAYLHNMAFIVLSCSESCDRDTEASSSTMVSKIRLSAVGKSSTYIF